MKKKFLCPALAACLLFAQVQPASAPTPLPIILILKCSAMLGLGEGAWLIYSCEPKSYLVRIGNGSEAFYIVSNKSLRTLKKDYDEVIRCEGPLKKPEAEQRAWENNNRVLSPDPMLPMWRCGPLGNCPTSPAYTNYLQITLTQNSTEIACTVIDSEDQWSFAVLPSTGTNNLSPGVLARVMDTDALATNTATAGNGLVAFGGTIEEVL